MPLAPTTPATVKTEPGPIHDLREHTAETQVTCPRCDGDGEEPGAPVDPDGIALCALCKGTREVSAAAAQAYREDPDED